MTIQAWRNNQKTDTLEDLNYNEAFQILYKPYVSIWEYFFDIYLCYKLFT